MEPRRWRAWGAQAAAHTATTATITDSQCRDERPPDHAISTRISSRIVTNLSR
jgi:hypothetical protein